MTELLSWRGRLPRSGYGTGEARAGKAWGVLPTVLPPRWLRNGPALSGEESRCARGAGAARPRVARRGTPARSAPGNATRRGLSAPGRLAPPGSILARARPARRRLRRTARPGSSPPGGRNDRHDVGPACHHHRLRTTARTRLRGDPRGLGALRGGRPRPRGPGPGLARPHPGGRAMSALNGAAVESPGQAAEDGRRDREEGR